jgi:hypothetical protein
VQAQPKEWIMSPKKSPKAIEKSVAATKAAARNKPVPGSGFRRWSDDEARERIEKAERAHVNAAWLIAEALYQMSQNRKLARLVGCTGYTQWAEQRFGYKTSAAEKLKAMYEHFAVKHAFSAELLEEIKEAGWTKLALIKAKRIGSNEEKIRELLGQSRSKIEGTAKPKREVRAAQQNEPTPQRPESPQPVPMAPIKPPVAVRPAESTAQRELEIELHVSALEKLGFGVVLFEGSKAVHFSRSIPSTARDLFELGTTEEQPAESKARVAS